MDDVLNEPNKRSFINRMTHCEITGFGFVYLCNKFMCI